MSEYVSVKCMYAARMYVYLYVRMFVFACVDS